MRKFNFRLQTVERHRKLQEQEKQVYLAKCLEKMRATEKKLLDLDKKEVQARREFSGLGAPGQEPGLNAAKFWMLDQFIQGQKVRRVDLKQMLEIDQQAVTQAYRDFLHARQQRKIMEKLHEKKLGQFKAEFRRHEGHLQDEQYVMRNRLKAGSNGPGSSEGGNS
ncbi:MAG: flagellar export protein FliJ [Bdellovibrionota bacterium]